MAAAEVAVDGKGAQDGGDGRKDESEMEIVDQVCSLTLLVSARFVFFVAAQSWI